MKPIKTILPVSAAIVLTVVLASCAGKYSQQSVLDTPEAHYQAGIEFLGRGQVAEARHEFEYAIGLERDFAPGYEGLGLCALEEGDGAGAEREFKRSIDRDRDYVPAHVGLGRAYVMQGQHNRGIRSFEDAIEIDPKYVPAYDYLGQTHVEVRDFDAAVDAYRRGINEIPTNAGLNDGWQRVSEMQRATLGVPDEYKEIALSVAVSRAELAVLLNSELDLQEIFVGRQTPQARTFVPPGQQNIEAGRIAAPTDVAGDHWARQHIEKCVLLGAIDLMPDGSFRPNQVVTRVDVAMLIQRVLVEAWDDASLKSRFFGSVSPFPDVPGTHFAFNAVMLATTRGIMTGRPDGTFFLEGTLPGHEAILIIRNLKGVLE